MKKPESITQAELMAAISYNKETGVFTRTSFTGNKCGENFKYKTEPGKYLSIGFNRRLYKAHRLAWLYVYGAFPNGNIDHIDGDTSNNAIANLRVVDQYQNNQNRGGSRSDSGTKLIGAFKSKTGGYWSAIRVDGVSKYLGFFTSAEAAHSAYMDAKLKFHTHADRLRNRAKELREEGK